VVRVFLRVMGQTLFERITRELAALNSAFPRTHLHGKPISWQLEKIQPPFIADHLRHTSQGLPVVLLEADDSRVIDHLWVISNREFLGMSAAQNHLNAPAPLIMFLPEDLPTTELLEMPPIVSDWVTMPSMHETVRRIFSSLNRFHRFHAEVTGGKLTLVAESRLLCFSSESIQLAPSEVAVAELFLHHFGSVIPLEDILLLFRLSGRSTEGSNIRVTMFQLRFKIEAVSRFQFTLTSAYGEGYVLRHARGPNPAHTYFPLEARQDVAVYNS
jgi:DNA-binding response OmpR family regulator